MLTPDNNPSSEFQNLQGERRPPLLSSDIRLFVLPNHRLTVGELDELRDQITYPGQPGRMVVFDNNPFAGVAPATIEQQLGERNDWLRIVDHHGYFNDGKEDAAFPRMLRIVAELEALGFRAPGVLAITNQGNLDPDGILTLFALRNPEKALQHAALLTEVTHFTDFAMFGGERIDDRYEAKHVPLAKQVGYALLRQITKLQEQAVSAHLAKPLEDATPDEIRGVYIPPIAEQQPAFNAAAVKRIYDSIVDDYVPRVLQQIEAGQKLHGEIWSDVQHSVARVRLVSQRARQVSAVMGIDGQFPAGKITLLTPDTGFSERLDKPYKVHDWLLEAAGQHVHDTPLYVRTFRGLTVISVRYPREEEARKFVFDMRPLIEALNELQPDSPFYGRKEVALGRLDQSKISTSKLVAIVADLWPKICKESTGDAAPIS